MSAGRERSASWASASGTSGSTQRVDRWLLKWPAVHAQFASFLDRLRRRQVRGSSRCARETLELLRLMMGTCRWASVQHMLDQVRAVGVQLMDAQPMELAIGNLVRRVLFIIREEHSALTSGGGGSRSDKLGAATMQPSLERMLSSDATSGVDYSESVKGVISNIMGQVGELMLELETVRESIMEQAVNHISDQSVILTFGSSRSIQQFLLAAAKNQKRRFQLFVAESAPYYGGQDMARALAERGVDVTVISDAAAFALMPRVDKVFLPTHAVMANGGLIAPSGGHMLALAAREHSVPVVVVTGLFKLCPLFPHNLEAFNELRSPAAVLDYSSCQSLPDAEVLNPAFDYVPPEWLDLYITNTGGHQPSYIYRLMSEYYHAADYNLVEEE